jgi:hypothetical protein
MIGALARCDETACLTAMQHLRDIWCWAARAEAEITSPAGNKPTGPLAVLIGWPRVLVPMAKSLTGESRATIQRNLAWMEGAARSASVAAVEKKRKISADRETYDLVTRSLSQLAVWAYRKPGRA